MGCWAGVATYLLWVLLLSGLLHCGLLHCCVEEERLALLQIQAYMNSYADPNADPWSFNGGKRDNCCQWSEVRCNESTGRVTDLDLSFKADLVAKDVRKKPWLFNVTLFRPFRKLISLDLSANGINGLVEDDGSTKISTLKKLRVLNLNSNDFEKGHISVRVLTSLRTLTLYSTGLNESNFPISQELANLRELQVLELCNNLFPGSHYIQGICKMKNLLKLDLSSNHISGGFPLCLLNLSSLQTLDLSHNYLSGTIPKKMSGLRYLEQLDLSFNNFEGGVSLPYLANLSNLQILQLSRNNLDVHLGDSWQPTFHLQSLGLQGCNLNKTWKTSLKFWSCQTNLSDLDLSDNNLFGAFPSWLLNHSKLKYLSLANNFFDKLPKNIGGVLSQLVHLNLSNNHFEGLVPTSIGDLGGLYTLDLSNNNFSGKLPTRLLSDCKSLSVLQLSNNKLEGNIIPEYMNLPGLSWLKLSNNLFGGTINEALRISTELYYLDISNNDVSGQLPRWIGNFSSLSTLSVSKNNLNGPIPKEICTVGAFYLDLSHNNFSGSIPSCSNFCHYTYMHFQGNSLTGEIPNSLSNCSYLQILDLRDNQLSGSIPLWIGKLSSLLALLLAGNNLHGSLPQQLCELRNLNILDLSHNDLYGGLPICFGNMSFGMKTMLINTELLLSVGVQLGQINLYDIPEEVEFLAKNQHFSYMGGNLVLMSGLDLSCNKLTGDIPPQLGDLKKIISLNLSNNLLSGIIPNQFSNLQQVESLDLSFNNLSGMIPSQLAVLTFLETFNVSYNNLSGRVPVVGQFGGFDESHYFGNPGLSGFPGSELQNQTEPLSPDTPSRDNKDGDHAGTFKVNFLWSFGMSSGVMFLATIAIMYINTQWRQASFDFIDRYLLLWLPMSWRFLY